MKKNDTNGIDDEAIEKLRKYNCKGEITNLINKIDEDYAESVRLANLIKEELSRNNGYIVDALKSVSEKTGYALNTLKVRYYSKDFYAYSKYFPDPCSKHNMDIAFIVIGKDRVLLDAKSINNEENYDKNNSAFSLLKKILKL